MTPVKVHIGHDALSALVSYCAEHSIDRVLMVADENTYEALGCRAHEALKASGCDVLLVKFTDDELAADADAVMDVLLNEDRQGRTYVSVGSGTITDITRLVSHRVGASFIALPTAPSVDGYASVSAPVVIRRFKKTVNAQGPEAIFGDLDTLANSPVAMRAAGFGDMLGKYICLADWQLGRILLEERYDEVVAAQTRQALENCVAVADGIGSGDPQAVKTLLEALVDSGLSMLAYGNSRPASGAEHHLSHFWEMKLLHEGRPAVLHGAKVGVGAVLMSERYHRLRTMTCDDVLDCLQKAEICSREQQEREIRAGYGELAESVIANYGPFLVSSGEIIRVCEKVMHHWYQIQEVAATVPEPEVMRDLLQRAGGAVEALELGLGNDERDAALHYARYLRPRFTILTLDAILGLEP